MAFQELHAGSARALITTAAAMLLSATFERDGTVVAPFARAPWKPAPERDRPAHLDVLGGEFAAVPFGSADMPAGAAGPWSRLGAREAPTVPHGHGANAEWTVLQATERAVRLGCDYPADSPVRRLERVVALRADGSAIDFELIVHARRAETLPVGVHPVFRLPAAPSAVAIEASFAEGWTYPGVVPPGASVAVPGRRFASLGAVPGPHGPVDLARLPLDHPVEEVLLLTGVRGPITVRFLDDGTGALLDWDHAPLPSVLLWISDRALGGDPWQHRYRGLGIEPVAAAFDLPPAVSAAPNPLSEAGVRTAIPLDPARALRVRSSVTPIFRTT